MKCSGHGDYESGDVAKTGDKLVLRGVFVVKRIWNWVIVFGCKLEFNQMFFDLRLLLCDQWNTAYNKKRKQEHFWTILWRVSELLKGNTSQKTIPVMWQYNVYNEYEQFKVAVSNWQFYMSLVMSYSFTMISMNWWH